jgi:hypothetical protein
MRVAYLFCVKTSLVLVLSLASCHRQPTVRMDCSGPWIPKHVVWSQLEGSLYDTRFSMSCPVLCFDSNGTFREYYWIVYGWGNAPESLCLGGEGGAEFSGRWEYRDGHVRVEYRLVDEVIHRVGESLPGPIQMDTVELLDQSTNLHELYLKNDTFIRSDRFCQRSMEMFIISQINDSLIDSLNSSRAGTLRGRK